MKIEFVRGEMQIGKVNAIFFGEAGSYNVHMVKDTDGNITEYKRNIVIVKQKYWYITILILCHELVHFVIDYITFRKVKVHNSSGEIEDWNFLHKVLDNQFRKIPKWVWGIK